MGWSQLWNKIMVLSKFYDLVFTYGAHPDAIGELIHASPLQRTEVGNDYQGGTSDSSESTEGFEIIYTYQLIYQLQLSRSWFMRLFKRPEMKNKGAYICVSGKRKETG